MHETFNIISFASSITGIISCIIIIILTKRMFKVLDELTSYMFAIYKKTKLMSSEIDDIRTLIDASLLKSLQSANHKQLRYPTSNEITDIESTITDQIKIKYSIANDLEVKSSNIINDIIKNVCSAFPEIQHDYIVEKTVSMLKEIDKYGQ